MKEDKFFKDKFDTKLFEEDIYNQLAKDMARCVDVDFAKTPVVDLFTGYSRYRVLQNRIDKAIEYIEENSDDMHTYISQVITQILKGSDKE